MKLFGKVFADQLSQLLPNQDIVLERPNIFSKGDHAFPCFKAAKALSINPAELAKRLASEIIIQGAVIEAAGPYLNLRLHEEERSRMTLVGRLEHSTLLTMANPNKTVLVEYSSPNIAKRFTIGHLRSTMIGHALANIFEWSGYRVIRLNHIGDWGTQFGTLLAAYDLWAKKDNPNLDQPFPWSKDDESNPTPLTRLLQLYVRFHLEEESNPGMLEDARAWFKKLEQGDEASKVLWKKFRDISLIEFRKLYDRLGVHFDSMEYGEAFYEDKIDDLISVLSEKKLLVEGEKGSQIVDLSDCGMETPCLIRKSDGATIYATRDLAAALFRRKEWNYDQCIYVVGSEQIHHFQQVFNVLNKIDGWFEGRQIHVHFGLIKLADGKMSSRKGNVIFLEDVIDEASHRVLNVINQKNPNLVQKEKVAEQLGLGAILFSNAFNDRNKAITFDWDAILAFEGDTGPYVQYAHARICSIFRKAGGDWSRLALPTKDMSKSDLTIPYPKFHQSLDLKGIHHSSAQHLLFEINGIEPSLDAARSSLMPTPLARQLLSIAKAFSTFYADSPILVETNTEDVKNVRLALCLITARVLAQGLRFLGIHAPQEM